MVDKNGVVTGVKAGTAIMTASTFDGKKMVCKVTVEKVSSLFQKVFKTVLSKVK